jgi:GntR family transcriptional regulator
VSDTPSQFLEKPLLTSPGQPLRVAVYSRIAHGIRTHVLVPGTALPREIELGQALRVSRTVVREALMLLEEDGLITTKRGVGRFIAEAVPHVGLEEFRPLDMVLAEPDATITVQNVEISLQETTDFVSSHIALEPGSQMWFREAIVSRDDGPIAIVQEYLPADDDRSTFGAAVAKALPDAASENSTVLLAILNRTGLTFSSGTCSIAVSVAGATRAKQLGLDAEDPVLLLTQSAELDGKPAYLAKVAIAPAVGHLSVRQSVGG